MITTLVERFGVLAVFVAVMIESLGVPLPGETVLVAAALVAGHGGHLSVWSIVGAAIAGAVIGDNIGYVLGHTFGWSLVARHGRRLHIDEAKLKVGRYLFDRHGGKVVFFGRFVSVLRTYAAFLAGVNHFKWPRFLLANTAAAIIWAVVFGVGAYKLGDIIERVGMIVGLVLLALVVVGAGAMLAFSRRRFSELARDAEAAYPGPLPGVEPA